MTWIGLYPTVKLLETTYKKGVTICKKMFKTIAARLERHVDLSKYYVTILFTIKNTHYIVSVSG